MKILIDSANIHSIKQLSDYYQIEGVTTNPTILAKEQSDYLQQLREIRQLIGENKMLFVQTISENATDIVEEAKKIISEIDENVYIKVPAIREGYKAMKELNQLGIDTLATAIYTAQQALMAARCGAAYVAPYVNRIDNVSGDGIKVVSEIIELFITHRLKTEVLAASFKNVNQVHKCSLVGAQFVTASPDIIEELHFHPCSELSVDQFTIDWKERFGKLTI
ncbi:transaldolase family protein [Alkalihalophilus lindianensis]|uniref:Transaldolase family protein n=1 Tax=Alkalihalophilus lindianensis TaxID=1630542 RepID=A0ABU3XBD5_9BACI|nr:transaldolase family protein [Alkalihalophilus lindianensis]MDV2685191.1 transaldolase family protein [Alkalihalophilus lindianensis]